jgi:hypothetical protein
MPYKIKEARRQKFPKGVLNNNLYKRAEVSYVYEQCGATVCPMV